MITAGHFASITLLILASLRLDLPAQTAKPAEIFGADLRFKHLTIDDGLSQGMVLAIHQDRQGFMWFGTKDGLNRYDGYRFTVFRHDPFDSTSLSNNFIQTLFEDRRGRLWIGTVDGLNCFDPATERFRRFAHARDDPYSLRDNNIVTICEAPNEAKGITVLWIGTFNGGLNKLVLRETPRGEERGAMGEERRVKGERPSPFALHPSLDHYFVRYQHDPDNPESLSSNWVGDLLVDQSGVLWIGTNQGLCRLDAQHVSSTADEANVRFTRYMQDAKTASSLPDNDCWSLCETRDGSIWVGTARGLARITSVSAAPAVFEYHDYPTGLFSPLRPNYIIAICDDRRGHLWLTTLWGVLVFDTKEKTYQRVQHDPADPASLISTGGHSIFRDRSGAIWIGTAGFGLSRWAPPAKQFHTYSPEKFALDPNVFSISTLLDDRRGLMWLFANHNLYQFNRQTGSFARHPSNIAFHEINAVYEDPALPLKPLKEGRGFVWITNSAGAFRYEARSRRIEKIFPQSEEQFLKLHAIHEDNDGDMWFGSVSALPDNPLTSPSRRHALYRWNRQTETVTEYPIPVPETFKGGWLEIRQIVPDRSGNFWLATNYGLLRFHPQQGTLKSFQNEPGNRASLTNNDVKTLLADPRQPERFLWLGTNGGGLNRFDLAAESFSHYTEEHGLPNNVVYGILSDDAGNLWMSTNKGLSKAILTPDTRVIVRFKNYDAGDGLQSNEFNTNAYFKNGGGEMFFGGIKGFTVFHPDSIRENSHAPPVVITDLQIRYQSVKLGQPGSPLRKTINTTEAIALAPEDNVMTFEFAALDYSAPEKNLYSYKLENFEENWSRPGHNRRATYTNLKPGKYVFRVRGSNNDGVWNEAGAQLAIEIKPYFYQTGWFAALGALALGLAFYGGHRWRLHYLEVRQRELKKLVAERTAQLRESEERVRKLNENLEQRVLERTDELQASHERLRALSAHLQALREQDRVTVARDLHDELGQVLTSLKMDLSMLERKTESANGQLEAPMILDEIDSMQKLVAATIKKVRNLITELRPEVLDTLGLVPALEWQLEEFRKRTGLPYEFDAAEAEELNIEKAHAVAVFRIFQESLTNIMRHAKARRVQVKLEHRDRALWVEIRDDGKGISAEDLDAPGKFGLLGMRERALVFGGEVAITGAAGQGTTVKITVPI